MGDNDGGILEPTAGAGDATPTVGEAAQAAGDSLNWAALAPLLMLLAAFLAYCVVTLIRNDVRSLPKWAWAILIFATVPLGGIAYLMLGRGHGESA